MRQLFEKYTSTVVLANANEAALTKNSFRNFERHILPRLPVDRRARVLDIGCGYGRYLMALDLAGYRDVYGIDVSEEQITYAQERLELSNCACVDALEFLSAQTGTYDVVLLLDVMEHLDVAYTVELCEAVQRALKPGGVFVVQAPNALSPFCPQLYADVTHQRAYTADSMEQTLRMGGFHSFEHFATPTPVHGVRSLARRTVCEVIVNPLLKAYFLIVMGSTLGGIYTPNLLTVTKKLSSESLSS